MHHKRTLTKHRLQRTAWGLRSSLELARLDLDVGGRSDLIVRPTIGRQDGLGPEDSYTGTIICAPGARLSLEYISNDEPPWSELPFIHNLVVHMGQLDEAFNSQLLCTLGSAHPAVVLFRDAFPTYKERLEWSAIRLQNHRSCNSLTYTRSKHLSPPTYTR